MPRGRDGDDSSVDNSLSAPPDAPSTEQYLPAHQHHASKWAKGSKGAGDDLVSYHARAISFNSETDVFDADEDTLTMPAPDSVQSAKRGSVPPPSLQKQQQRRSPQKTSVAAQQQQQQQHETLLLPPPYDRPSSPSAAAQNVSQPLIPHPKPSRSPSASQWQLNSPKDRARAAHDTTSRGAVFEYASEAVNTLEQQYGDALQRLGTMHRLYDRLDEQNRKLEEEVVRLRRINDVLEKGVAINIYSGIRQMKHEMKLLKQYVAVLCTGFSSSMEALQQVVAEDVPRLLMKDSGYTALLPYGVQGRLRSMETRVSVGRSSNQHGAFAASPPLPWDSATGMLNASGNGGGGGVSVMAEQQLYEPGYWWNAMSPQPLRPPNTQEAEEDQSQRQPTDMSAVNREVDYHNGNGIGGQTVDHHALFDVDKNGHHDSQQQQQNESSKEPVPFQAYRRVQTALAEVQRRVVELERQNSSQQADYEVRVAQLKAAHRAREARLEEELTLLKRIEPIEIEGNASPYMAMSSTAGGVKAPTMSVDINALAQLLADLQKQQPQPQKPASASAVPVGVADNTHRLRAERTVALSGNADEVDWRSEEEAEDKNDDDDGMVDSRDPHSTANDGSSHENRGDEDYDFYYGNGDPSRSYERANRRILQAVALGRNRPHTVSGDDGRLHLPDRFSSTAAARRSERARQVLGEDAQHSTTKHMPRCFAYDRLVDRRDDLAGPSASSARRTRKASPQGAAPGGHSRKREAEERRGGNGGRRNNKRGVDLLSVDPALLQSALAQLLLGSSSGDQTCVSQSTHARTLMGAKTASKADRLAQGLWAQEMLKERNCM